MRIQHNIMAMGAYRNYTNNLSAMQKNLEKLSSGYKINRAGDDAAGLAISEKMRAQITGLTAAQKNAKDGISLVQTAEGALTEVHDMLNRMVQLATQSANGTYDNETDRDQLQKEMNQLRSEIDRIADASNFNGIKLLDGSMDSDAGLTGVKYTDVELKDLMKLFVNKDVDGVNQGDPLGGKDIMEKDSGETGPGSFEIDLDGIGELDIAEGQKFAITVGDATIESDKLAAGKYDSKKLAEALDGKEITINADGKDRVFTAKADGGKLTFTTEDPEDFKLSANDKVGWKVLKAETPEPDFEPAAVEGTLEATTSTALNGTGPTSAKYSATLTVAAADKLVEGNTIQIGTDTYTIVDGNVHTIRGDEVDLNEINTEEGLKKFIAEKLNDADNDYDISVNEDGDLVYEAYKPGEVGAGYEGPAAAPNAAGTITFAQGKAAAIDASISATVGTANQEDAGADSVAADAFIKLSDADNDAIAAAAQKLGVADGAKFTIQQNDDGDKVQLIADGKVIGEADYTFDGSVSTTVTFKDADGNALLKASLVKVDDGDLGTDGFDIGLTFKAQVGTPDGAGGAAGSSEDGLMALAEGDDAGTTTGTPAEIGGSLTATVTVGGSEAVQAQVSVGVAYTSSSSPVDNPSFTAGDKVQIAASGGTNSFDLTFTVDGQSAWTLDGTASNTELTGYTATFDGTTLTLTQDTAADTTLNISDFGTITVTPTSSSADGANGTVSIDQDGAAAVAGQDVSLSDADTTAILAATDGKTIADGAKFTIKSDGTNVALYAGDTKISANATFSAAEVTFADADGNVLLKANFSNLSDIGDIPSDGIDTGLTYTAATSGPDDPGTDDPGTVGGNNLVGDLTQTTHLKDLPDFGKDTTLSADQITELESIFDNAGSGTGTVTIPGSNASLALKDIDLTGVNTIGDVAQKIFDAADAAVKAANENVAEGGKKYEVVGVYSDAAYTNLLAGPGDAAGTQAISANDGFYIKTRELADTPVDDGTVEVAGGTINSGLQNVKDNVTGSSDQLAHVVVDFNEVGAWSDGAKITIGDTDYTVAVGKDSKFKGAANVIDLTDMEAGDIKKDVAAQRLTVAANANKTFVVGHDGTGKTVLKQRSDVKDKT